MEELKYTVRRKYSININDDGRLSETDCYKILYGGMIDCVEHYKKRTPFIRFMRVSPISQIIFKIYGGGGSGSEGN